MTSTGIPTRYRGVRYRSRPEAKWAAFFDEIGWHHTYEPFDAAGYIPDFVIHGDRPLLVEVKPAVTRADYEAPIEKLVTSLHGRWRHNIMIVGADPQPASLNGCPGLVGRWDDDGTHGPSSWGCTDPMRYWMFDTTGYTPLILCYQCDRISVLGGNNCDCWSDILDKDGFPSVGSGWNLADPSLAWANAANANQWRGR